MGDQGRSNGQENVVLGLIHGRSLARPRRMATGSQIPVDMATGSHMVRP
jgi:hypothetical protein